MLKSYLQSLYRNINRNRFYTFLNLLGLAVGLAAAFIILLYVQDELAYDKYNKNHKRIYRIESDVSVNSKHSLFATAPVPMGPAFKLEFPEVEEFTRFRMVGTTVFDYNDKAFFEDKFCLADSSVFDVFTFPFVSGVPENALSEPFTIVLTQATAKKYFGDVNPVGMSLHSKSNGDFRITGVIEDLPGNSHLKFDALLSMSSLAKLLGEESFNSMEPKKFWNLGIFTFILLKNNVSISAIAEKYPAFYEKYMKSLGDQINGNFELTFTPLSKTHFQKGLLSDMPNGNMEYVLVFSLAALFMLLIAAINYMNMATARSSKRAREIGIRKVLGSDRGQLIRQFTIESVVMAIVSFLVALLIVVLVLPEFNNFTTKTISLSFFQNPVIYLEMLAIALLAGLLSGLYPAFYLSSFQPVRVLKGKVGSTGKSGGLFRKVLVVFQFMIAIFMIIGTIVVSEQLSFLKHNDPGFIKDDLVIVDLSDSDYIEKVATLKDELLKNSNIISVTNSSGFPGRFTQIRTMKVEQEMEMEQLSVVYSLADYDFIQTFGLELIDGRNFDRQMGSDAQEAVIVNQTAVKDFGWEDNPLGKRIHYRYNKDGSGGRMLKVVGVVNDFHFKSLHSKIEPVIFLMNDAPETYLCIRVNGKNRAEALRFLEEKWNEFDADQPLSYSFLENIMDEMYTAEVKIDALIKIAAFITIFIALLGLLGLSSFLATQKTKEIGLRKIHGASIGNILMSFYREFALLILIAFVITVPMAYWRLEIWLESNFVFYKTQEWPVFIIAGAIAITVGLGTISYHVVRAALRNPVDSIKYE
ncbi:MAG: ABC transporter permease [Bacteroidales bacterium]